MIISPKYKHVPAWDTLLRGVRGSINYIKLQIIYAVNWAKAFYIQFSFDFHQLNFMHPVGLEPASSDMNRSILPIELRVLLKNDYYFLNMLQYKKTERQIFPTVHFPK